MPVSGLILRQSKGSPLTMQEMDNNLQLLGDFANALEALISISLNPDGTIKNPGFFYAQSTTGTDAYVITAPNTPALVNLVGKVVVLKVDVANIGPATLEVNSLGAKAILKFQDQPLESNEIKATKLALLIYDAVADKFILLSQPGVVLPDNYGVDTGAVDAYMVAQTGSIAIPDTLFDGYTITVKALNTNTGASTLAVGAHVPINIRRNGADVLQAGDIVGGQFFQARYDGSNFQLPGAGGSRLSAILADASTLDVRLGTTYEVNHNLGVTPQFVRAVLVCVIADIGFSPGDEIDIETVQQNDSGMLDEDSNFTLYANATKVGVVVNNVGSFNTPMKSGGGIAALTVAKWRIKLYAAKL